MRLFKRIYDSIDSFIFWHSEILKTIFVVIFFIFSIIIVYFIIVMVINTPSEYLSREEECQQKDGEMKVESMFYSNRAGGDTVKCMNGKEVILLSEFPVKREEK